jgi:hypothetical protein
VSVAKMRYDSSATRDWITLMKVKSVLRQMVWTAVIATLCGVGSIVSAILGWSDISISLGLVAIASAVMSAREAK